MPADDSSWVILDSIPSQAQNQCIKVRNDTVFCAVQADSVQYRDRLTGAVIGAFPALTGPGVIAICPFGDSICVSRISAPEYCEVYTLSGTYVRTFLPSGGQQVRGLDWDGSKFWATSFTSPNFTIYTMTPDGTVLKTLARSGGVVAPTIGRDLVLDPMYENRLWSMPHSSGGPFLAMYCSFDTVANTWTPLETFPTGLPYYMSGIGFYDDPVDGGCVYASTFSGARIWRVKVHEPLPTQLRLLWLYSDFAQPDTTLGVRLQALGDSVEYYSVQVAVPLLAELLPYDAVGVNSNYGFLDPNALGNVLADYVDGGGGVVLANFCFTSDGNGMGGRIMTGDYATLTQGDNSFLTQPLGWHNAAHPVMTGVTSVQDFYRTEPSLCPGAESVANWADGRPYVAVSANHRVVGLNQYPGIVYHPDRQGDWALVIHNALAYVAGFVTAIETPGQPAAVPGLALSVAPNPARTAATIRYSVPAGNAVRLALYDQTGRLIQACPSSSPGIGVWGLDIAVLRPGVYFCRLRAGSATLTRKLVVQR
jgi:hypothetical protein